MIPPAGRRARLAAAIAALGLAASGCSSLEAYSVRVAEDSCSSLSVCTVYGPGGERQSPCISTGLQTIYPGDPRWPYTTPGVCDAVRDGVVVSTGKDPASAAPEPQAAAPPP